MSIWIFVIFFHKHHLLVIWFWLKTPTHLRGNNKEKSIDSFCHVPSIIQPLPTHPLMHGCIPAHQLSSLGNKRRCQAFSMTSHPTASFQHGVQPGAGEGGPGGAEARCDRKPRLQPPQILPAHHYRTDRSPQTDGTHQRGDWPRYGLFHPASYSYCISLCFRIKKKMPASSCRLNHHRGCYSDPIAVFM